MDEWVNKLIFNNVILPTNATWGTYVLEIFMILIGIVLMILAIRQMRQTKKFVLATSQIKKLDFDGDMKFLMFMINSKVSYHIEYRIKPLLKQHKTGVIKDDAIEKTTEEISNDILRIMGDKYRLCLTNYLDNTEGIVVFISELVFILVTNEILILNKQKLIGPAMQNVIDTVKENE